MKRGIATRRRLAVLGLVGAVVVAVIGVGPIALDRLGYCVEDVLPGDPELATDPYIQHVTQDAAVIRWWTADETAGSVAWGRGVELAAEATVAAGESHTALLTDLELGREYRYRVRGDGIDAAGAFRTAPGADATVTIGVLGDTGAGGDAQRDVAAVLTGIDPDLVLITGDVVYRRGALCDYDEKFFAPYESLLGSAPFYAAVGNHDLMAEDGAAFDQVFGVPRDRPGRWFSFDYGPAHIVVLDSEVYHPADPAAIAAQKAWLDADLRATSLPWTIVVLHRPPFSSTGNQADAALRDDLTPVFAGAGADLVLAGHSHNYERLAPVDGVTYVVTGGGGAELHDMEPGPDTAAAAVAYHALKLTVSPERLAMEAIGRDGREIDRAVLAPAAS